MPKPPKNPPLRENYVQGVILRRATYLLAVSTLFPKSSIELAMMFINAVLKPTDPRVRGTVVIRPELPTGCPSLIPDVEADARLWAKTWGFEDVWAWDVMLHTLAHWQQNGLGVPLGQAPEFHRDALWCPRMTGGLYQEALARLEQMTLPEVGFDAPAMGPTIGLLGLLQQQELNPLQGGKAYRDYAFPNETRADAKSRQRLEMKRFWSNENYSLYCEQIEARVLLANAGGLPIKEKLVTHAMWTAIRRVKRWKYDRIAEWASQTKSEYENINATTVRRAVNSFCEEIDLTL